VTESEKEARDRAQEKAEEMKKQMLAQRRKMSLESISQSLKEGAEIKTVKIVLKADVQGSLEALLTAINKLHMDTVKVNVIHSGTGVVNESDVMLARASDAIVLSFSAGVSPEAVQIGDKVEVEIRDYDIIYKLLDEREKALEGMLEPEYEDVEIGKLEIRSIFKSSKTGNIAGCYVMEGKVIRNAKAQIFRKNDYLAEGKVDNLKRFKDDVKEVATNYECGLTIEGFQDYQEGDTVVVLETREKTS